MFNNIKERLFEFFVGVLFVIPIAGLVIMFANIGNALWWFVLILTFMLCVLVVWALGFTVIDLFKVKK